MMVIVLIKGLSHGQRTTVIGGSKLISHRGGELTATKFLFSNFNLSKYLINIHNPNNRENDFDTYIYANKHTYSY